MSKPRNAPVSLKPSRVDAFQARAIQWERSDVATPPTDPEGCPNGDYKALARVLERELEAAISRFSEACSYREAVDMLRAHREAAVLFDVGVEFLRGYDHAITTLACRLPKGPK